MDADFAWGLADPSTLEQQRSTWDTGRVLQGSMARCGTAHPIPPLCKGREGGVDREALQALGLQVIRYTNDEVLNNVAGVLEDLGRRLSL